MLIMGIGEGGLDTAAWANAAGMYNFETYYNKCKLHLRTDFDWPPGIEEVRYGWEDPIKKSDKRLPPDVTIPENTDIDCLFPY